MTPLLIPEDKLLDVPDEVLFAEVKTILKELNISEDDLKRISSDEELNIHYQHFLKLVENK